MRGRRPSVGKRDGRKLLQNAATEEAVKGAFNVSPLYQDRSVNHINDHQKSRRETSYGDAVAATGACTSSATASAAYDDLDRRFDADDWSLARERIADG